MLLAPSDIVLDDIRTTSELNLGHDTTALRLGKSEDGRLVMRMQKVNHSYVLEMYLDDATIIAILQWLNLPRKDKKSG